jgi:hypothetical protein
MGLEDVEASRSVDNRHTVGGEAVSFMIRPPFTSRKIPGTYLCLRLSRFQAVVRLEGLGQLKNQMTSSRIKQSNTRSSGLSYSVSTNYSTTFHIIICY